MPFDNEESLISAAVALFTALGIEAFPAVPCLSRCIDLVITNRSMTSAIEFKLRDWRKGLIQAADHRLAVDKTYVCLPVRKVSDSMEQAFADAGVGLLLYDDDSEMPLIEAIESPNSTVKWQIASQWLKDTLEARRRLYGFEP